MTNPLDKLKSVCDAATKGPMVAEEHYCLYDITNGVYGKGRYFISEGMTKEDAELFVTARAALPILIEVIEKQREALEKNLKHSTLFLGGNTGSQMMAAYVQDYSKQALTETAKMLERIGNE